MNVMIFAAGKGTRLKPLTDIIPKALVPVDDKPLLQHVLERVTAFVGSGVSDAPKPTIVINTHHHAEQIRNFINITRDHWQADIQLSDESDRLLETGGGLRKAAPLFNNDNPILIHNVDILSNVDLQALYAQATAEAILLVSSRKTSRYLLFDDDMRLVGWKNISTGELKGREGTKMYAFSGIHVISKNLIKVMDSWPEAFPIMDFYLSVCKDHDIRGIVKDNLKLLDVGKLDTLESASSFLSSL